MTSGLRTERESICVVVSHYTYGNTLQQQKETQASLGVHSSVCPKGTTGGPSRLLPPHSRLPFGMVFKEECSPYPLKRTTDHTGTGWHLGSRGEMSQGKLWEGPQVCKPFGVQAAPIPVFKAAGEAFCWESFQFLATSTLFPQIRLCLVWPQGEAPDTCHTDMDGCLEVLMYSAGCLPPASE